jgi:hypothetical protein
MLPQLGFALFNYLFKVLPPTAYGGRHSREETSRETIDSLSKRELRPRQ